jgi:hypothetical protein
MRLPTLTVSRTLGACVHPAKMIRQRAQLHTVMKLPYEHLEPEVNGLYPVYSAEGFKVAWTERQKSLINEVNYLTQGT